MEEFYQMLRSCNLNLYQGKGPFPRWLLKYTEPVIPKSFKILHQILKNECRSSRIVEIGAGAGDVTAFLIQEGFLNIHSYERDTYLGQLANEKISCLFGRIDIVSCQEFSINTYDDADILLLYNCIYWESWMKKKDFCKKLVSFYKHANRPHVYIIEVPDAEYMISEEVFPRFTWISTSDMREMFPGKKISSFISYQRLDLGITKRIYRICR